MCKSLHNVVVFPHFLTKICPIAATNCKETAHFHSCVKMLASPQVKVFSPLLYLLCSALTQMPTFLIPTY